MVTSIVVPHIFFNRSFLVNLTYFSQLMHTHESVILCVYYRSPHYFFPHFFAFKASHCLRNREIGGTVKKSDVKMIIRVDRRSSDMSDSVGRSGVIFHCHWEIKHDCRPDREVVGSQQSWQNNRRKFNPIDPLTADPPNFLIVEQLDASFSLFRNLF